MTAFDPSGAPPMLTLRTASGVQARMTAQGAQVMSWTPGGRERLFTSPRAVFQPGKAIRGGIPIIFPQFGDRGPGLRHGFARLLEWTPMPALGQPDRAALVLSESEESLRWWPYRFRAELEVHLLDDRLSISIAISNHDEVGFDFTAALHTYLRVSDIGQVGLLGLQGQPFLDAVNGRKPGVQTEETLRFAGEVERVYPGSAGRELIVADAAGATRVGAAGFNDTVVWNPGPGLAAGLADLGPGQHANFLCVEAASVETPVRLSPGERWRGSQVLTCCPTTAPLR